MKNLLYVLLFQNLLFGDYIAKINYYCDSGDTLDLSSKKCINPDGGQTKTFYYCNSGILNGNKCASVSNPSTGWKYVAGYQFFAHARTFKTYQQLWVDAWIVAMNGGYIGTPDMITNKSCDNVSPSCATPLEIKYPSGCWNSSTMCSTNIFYCASGTLNNITKLCENISPALIGNSMIPFDYPAHEVKSCPLGGDLAGNNCLSEFTCSIDLNSINSGKHSEFLSDDHAYSTDLYCENTSIPFLPSSINIKNIPLPEIDGNYFVRKYYNLEQAKISYKNLEISESTNIFSNNNAKYITNQNNQKILNQNYKEDAPLIYRKVTNIINTNLQEESGNMSDILNQKLQ